MTDEERIFRRDYLFSKADILRSLELQMEYIEHDPDTGYTKRLIENKLALYKKLYGKVEKGIYPELTELYWYYRYHYTGTGLELWLCSGDDIELSEDKERISSMTDDSEQLLIRVECDYVSPETFARIQEVSLPTVKQWLKKGKLRYAKFEEGNWLIPSTSEKPKSSDYGFIQYTLDPDNPPIIEDFPIVAACDSITIFKNESGFICHFDNYDKKFFQKVVLSREDVERLEYALIKSGKAVAGIPIQFVVGLDRD